MSSIRSLRNFLYIILSALGLQLIIVAADLFLQVEHDERESALESVSAVETMFLEGLTMELVAEKDPRVRTELDMVWEQLLFRLTEVEVPLQQQVVTNRVALNQQLQGLWDERERLYTGLNSSLPNLAASVTYIHSHHLAYLGNLLHRGQYQPVPDDTDSFTKDDARPASELEILGAAIGIQNSVLRIIEIFSRLQRGLSPKEIERDFRQATSQLYRATAAFDDYSLDAQDGLLVEELLENGRSFELSFTRFLAMESERTEVLTALNDNRSGFISLLGELRQEHRTSYNSFRNRLHVITIGSATITLMMFVGLLLLSHLVIRAIAQAVKETAVIRENPDYRIALKDNQFFEFNFLFSTLNSLAEEVTRRLVELEEIQKDLEKQVELRTRELGKINLHLRKEIEERNRQEAERRTLEERLARAEKMEALGTLAGGVAHDLNNILSGLVSFPDVLLLDLPEDHHLRPPLETIRESGYKAAVIVEDLLTMARRGVARQEPFTLNELVTSFWESPEFLRIRENHPLVVFSCVLTSAMNMVHGSRVHILKSLTNLVTNGAEAIAGNGLVKVSTHTLYMDTTFKRYDQVQEGEYVQLRVTDDGGGIEPENLEKIFEPFFTTKAMGRSGSGLGMPVVWGTVKDHQGYLDVSSSPEGGTTFDLYFPLVRDDDVLVVTQELAEADLVGEGQLVLVVDDVKEQRDIATLMLKRLGYEVAAVASGEGAIAYLHEHTADILLLDMIMQPGIDGLETYRRIVKKRPGQKAIIVSGYSESDKVHEAQSLGTGAYVKKPYSLKQLGMAVKTELNR